MQWAYVIQRLNWQFECILSTDIFYNKQPNNTHAKKRKIAQKNRVHEKNATLAPQNGVMSTWKVVYLIFADDIVKCEFDTA